MFDAKAMVCCFNVCHFPSHYMIGSLPRGAHGIFQSSRTGSSVDFYVVRNILDTRHAGLFPSFSIIVGPRSARHVTLCVDCFRRTTAYLAFPIEYAPWVESSRIHSSATAPKDTITQDTPHLPPHRTTATATSCLAQRTTGSICL
jgi:hypothetical protein